MGTLQYAAGGILQGEFRDGLIWKGSGSALVGEGIYEGEWEEGQCHGYGRMQYSGGKALEGEFKEGMIWNGSGILRLKNGEVREGTWKNGKMEGMGRQRLVDGRESVGVFRSGRVYTGITTRQIDNGQRYSGGMQEGKKHGKGHLVNADGTVLKGEFQHDQIYCGEGVLMHGGRGERHEGRWLDGLLHGYGIVTRGGEKLEGPWKAGVLHGDSCYVRTAWGTYEGSMQAGKRHGPGKLQYTAVPVATEAAISQPYQQVLQRVLEGEFREGAIHIGMGLVDSRWPELYRGDWVVRPRSQRSTTYHIDQKRMQPRHLERQLIWGEFREGSIHTGKGWLLLEEDGALYSSSWVDGVRVGELRHTPAEEVDKQSAVYMLLVQQAAPYGRRRHRTATTVPGDPKVRSSKEDSNYYPAAGVSGAVFSGLLDDRGRYDGHGTLTLLSGDHLEGHFYRGKLEGPGEHWYASGAVFRGQYHNNARHGAGMLTNADGSVLQGVFQHGHIYTGSGVLIKHRSGDRYHGTWEKGQMQGAGSITYAADGTTVTGKFLDGVFRPHEQKPEQEPTNPPSPAPTTTATAETNTEQDISTTSSTKASSSSNGFGSWLLGEPTQSNYLPIKLPPLPPVIAGNIATGTDTDSTEPVPFLQQVLLNNGDLLTGVFPKHFGKLHGYGEYRYTDTRNVFRGYFRRGTRHGVGILYYADGRTLEGEFRHGNIKNGRGLLKRSNGEYFDGVWVNSAFTGTGRKLYANGRTLEGEFRDGTIWTGQGHTDYGGGHIYEGHYQNGLMHGAGVFSFPDGRTLSGEFQNGELHTGRDISIAADGSVVSEIVWEDGRRVT